MKKLTREEMRSVSGGTSGTLYSCNSVGNPNGYTGYFCHSGNPIDHTDPSCSDFLSCIVGGTCSNPYLCP